MPLTDVEQTEPLDCSHGGPYQSRLFYCGHKVLDLCMPLNCLDPNNSMAYINRGLYVHSKRGDFDKALHDYNQAVQFAPRLSAAYRARAEIYFKKGDYTKAIEDYDR